MLDACAPLYSPASTPHTQHPHSNQYVCTMQYIYLQQEQENRANTTTNIAGRLSPRAVCVQIYIYFIIWHKRNWNWSSFFNRINTESPKLYLLWKYSVAVFLFFYLHSSMKTSRMVNARVGHATSFLDANIHGHSLSHRFTFVSISGDTANIGPALHPRASVGQMSLPTVLL